MLRRDAHLRRLYSGPRGDGPGRPKTYDGKVDVSDLAHCEQVDAGDADITLHSQVACKTRSPQKVNLTRIVNLCGLAGLFGGHRYWGSPLYVPTILAAAC